MLTDQTISLNNIRLYAFHGVMPQERKVGGWYRVSVSVGYPYERALCTDDVADTLNYALMFDVIRREMSQPSNLIEHVAGRIGNALLVEFVSITEVRVEITKENPPMGANCDGASCSIRLKR